MVLTSSVVSHVWFLVKDLDKAVRFFGEVLGLKLLESWKGAARFDGGNLTIGLRQVAEMEVANPIITFRMEKGIGKFHAYLRKQGVRSKMVDLDFIGKVLSLEDPEGHQLWVHEPGEESPEVSG